VRGGPWAGLLDHLRAGQGELFAAAGHPGMLLARVWSLARGRSGVSPLIIDTLCAALAVPSRRPFPSWARWARVEI